MDLVSQKSFHAWILSTIAMWNASGVFQAISTLVSAISAAVIIWYYIGKIKETNERRKLRRERFERRKY
ncbi:hypothetical protein HOP38_02635 [Vibrio mediterranei]|uniref:hypothetical protein n=1 Tax=Vibrio mediterranei TaxID=689 RepID=UPI0018159938|nr:hypothetical protein [Vibrio mediterranei]NUW71407.1 hypothetical protein [Vibrio mediterranei]